MTNPRRIKRVDDFFELDRFQFVVLFLNELFIFTNITNLFFNIFGTAPPILLGCDDVFYNGTKAEVCAQYINHTSCREPIVQYEFLSTIVEFNQFCGTKEKTWMDSIISPLGISNKPKLSTTVQMIGIMIGSAISGHLSDLYGRKKIALAILIFLLTVSTSCSLSPSMDVYIVFRFFIGIGFGGLVTVGNVFVVEMLPAKHRLWMCTLVTWAPNYIIFAFVAYMTGHWRTLSRVTNAATLIAVLFCAFVVPESPKFLVQRGRKKEAIEALKYVNTWKSEENRVSDEEIEEIVESTCEAACRGCASKKKYNFLHLYSTGTLALRTIVCTFMMFTITCVTSGLVFNLDQIKGSIYKNTALTGCLRWTIDSTVALVDHFGGKDVGRKRLHFATMSTILFGMAGTYILYNLGVVSDYPGVARALTLLSVGPTGCIFLQYCLITAELFPTAIRNLANAHINVCGRIGNVFGPLVFSLAVPIEGFPYLLMATLSCCSIILFQSFIPETKGQPLPEMPARSMEDDVQVEEPLVKAS